MSTDSPGTSAALRKRLKSRFTFLSDEQGELLDALAIRHPAASMEGADIAFPTAILVDGAGIVRWSFQADTYRQRARPEDVFRAVEQLS